MKILSPAGNFECLKAAVYNGADEVYLGINDFNARNNINGFTIDNLEEAVDFAHFYGVKVLLAINILFTDDELKKALDIACRAYNMGVDAFIVQDLGLIKLLSTFYPQIELHASTQMGIHNLEGVKALEKYNIKRVVLARETPLEEVKRIKTNTNVEIEYFCQGALCVSFSGNCYLSSYLLGQSGNRGRCKQLCRLPFTLENDGKKLKRGYLLSAKDFNMSERLADLKAADVDVIKIEGRARRPFYVAAATREYAKALNGKEVEQDNLKLAFNRTYTAGYFDGNGNIISDIQNHIGVEIGNVRKVEFGKNFNKIYFSSSRQLYPKSVFKFVGQDETTVAAYDLQHLGSDRYMLTTTQKVCKDDKVYLIVDEKLESNTLASSLKRHIDISILAYPNNPIVARYDIDGQTFVEEGAICSSAISHPLTEMEIAQNFSKSPIFDATVTIKTDAAFLPKKDLNEFRRKVFLAAYEKITSRYKKNLQPIKLFPKGKVLSFADFAFVEDTEFSVKEHNVIYSPEIYTVDGVKAFIAQCAIKNKTPYLDMPNFALEKDITVLKDILSKTNISIIANNYYALDLVPNTVIGGGLNVYNSIAAAEYGRQIITSESNIGTKSKFPYMTLRHCPMKNLLGATCEKCSYSNQYAYRMDNGKLLQLKRKKLSTCTFYLAER